MNWRHISLRRDSRSTKRSNKQFSSIILNSSKWLAHRSTPTRDSSSLSKKKALIVREAQMMTTIQGRDRLIRILASACIPLAARTIFLKKARQKPKIQGRPSASLKRNSLHETELVIRMMASVKVKIMTSNSSKYFSSRSRTRLETLLSRWEAKTLEAAIMLAPTSTKMTVAASRNPVEDNSTSQNYLWTHKRCPNRFTTEKTH